MEIDLQRTLKGEREGPFSFFPFFIDSRTERVVYL